MDLSSYGFGITSTVSGDIVRALAPQIEAAGFRTLWVNHIPGGSSLSSIQIAVEVTSTLRFATGVIPVDKGMSADEIVADVRERELPLDRLTIGIGASEPPSPLTRVREAGARIRDELGVPVIVGALGPRMRAVGMADLDGLLLNWLTPGAAQEAMSEAQRDAGGREGKVALYVRCALGQENAGAMEREAERYAAMPSYKANFDRLGLTAIGAAVLVEEPSGLRERLEAFRGVIDEPVLRAITADQTLDAYASLVSAVAD